MAHVPIVLEYDGVAAQDEKGRGDVLGKTKEDSLSGLLVQGSVPGSHRHPASPLAMVDGLADDRSDDDAKLSLDDGPEQASA